MSYAAELQVAIDAARAAGERLRREASRDGGPRGSGYHADVDDEICAELVATLGAAFPDDEVISEELPPRPGSSGRVWHIDPHDGTHHFLQGARDTSISIGLAVGGELPLGVVYAPLESPLTGAHGTLVAWAEGAAFTVNDAAPAARGRADALLVSPGLRGQARARAQAAVAPAQLAGCGSVATRFALVAAGQALGGVCVYNVLASWDYAAGQALLRARGGALVDGAGARIAWRDGLPQAPRTMDWFGAGSLEAAQGLARRYRELLQRD
ncbi:MAG: inositol monophosphatase family protein [Planctomycetota bacterium]